LSTCSSPAVRPDWSADFRILAGEPAVGSGAGPLLLQVSGESVGCRASFGGRQSCPPRGEVFPRASGDCEDSPSGWRCSAHGRLGCRGGGLHPASADSRGLTAIAEPGKVAVGSHERSGGAGPPSDFVLQHGRVVERVVLDPAGALMRRPASSAQNDHSVAARTAVPDPSFRPASGQACGGPRVDGALLTRIRDG
jgi:hypothetical protein